MNLSQPFQKTSKGEGAIAQRGHDLAPRARSLLIMVNGKLTGEELHKRGELLGGGADLFGLLVDGGYVEPMEVSVDVPVMAAPVPPKFTVSHAETAKFASHFIVEAMGPAYDELGGRVETCRDPIKLLSLLESVRDVIANNVGSKKAEAFWVGVTARLPT